MSKMIHVLLALFIPVAAYAQQGLDMVNNEMIINGLFIPHANNCKSSTEVFVEVGSHPQRGFCIEKTERAGGTVTWEVARQTCADDDKRLPEAVEYRIACLNPPSGLVDMTDDQEWAGNFPRFGFTDWTSPTSLQFLAADVVGDSSCDSYRPGEIMSLNTSIFTALFRCVR